MDDDIKGKLITRYAIAGVLSLLAYSLLWYAAGWMIALAIFILHISMNVERNADLVRALWKFHNAL